MKIFVEIPEVHKVTVEVEVADDATREEICAVANQKLATSDSLDMEYTLTLENDEYTIRDVDGNFFEDKGFGQIK